MTALELIGELRGVLERSRIALDAAAAELERCQVEIAQLRSDLADARRENAALRLAAAAAAHPYRRVGLA